MMAVTATNSAPGAHDRLKDPLATIVPRRQADLPIEDWAGQARSWTHAVGR